MQAIKTNKTPVKFLHGILPKKLGIWRDLCYNTLRVLPRVGGLGSCFVLNILCTNREPNNFLCTALLLLQSGKEVPAHVHNVRRINSICDILSASV